MDSDTDGIVDYYDPDILSTSDYYPFGLAMEGRTYSNTEYRFGFNGMEKDQSIAFGHYDLGLRIYNPITARMFNVDPRTKEYPWQSPYVYHKNSPIFILDYLGGGGDDRVKKAKSFTGKTYKQQTEWLKDGSRTYLRTGKSVKALEYIDCSELVCRVLAADGITPEIKSMGTKELVEFLGNETKFHKSQTPKVGDIFIYRVEYEDGTGKGHTGIVSGVSEDGKTVQITHARSPKRGVGTNKGVSTSYLTSKAGWQGFFRPIEEWEGSDQYKAIMLKKEIKYAQGSVKRWERLVDQYEKWNDGLAGVYELYALAARANLNSLEQNGIADHSFYKEARKAHAYYQKHQTLPWPEDSNENIESNNNGMTDGN